MRGFVSCPGPLHGEVAELKPEHRCLNSETTFQWFPFQCFLVFAVPFQKLFFYFESKKKSLVLETDFIIWASSFGIVWSALDGGSALRGKSLVPCTGSKPFPYVS